MSLKETQLNQEIANLKITLAQREDQLSDLTDQLPKDLE